jgi:UDP-2,3-diacylglucosamine pyrophosphatase LpxH
MVNNSRFMHTTNTLIISDIHLGSSVSRSKELLHRLKSLTFERLILNGDIFDDLNFTRLHHDDWALLTYLRELSNPEKKVELIWVVGNHDGPANTLSHLIGVPVRDEYAFEWYGKQCLVIHGHQFDRFLNKNIVISAVASTIYSLIQHIDTKQQFMSRFLKRASKSWLRISKKVAHGAVRHAETENKDVVFCGHTHREMELKIGRVEYYNSGCWTDIPSAYITLKDGEIVIHKEK